MDNGISEEAHAMAVEAAQKDAALMADLQEKRRIAKEQVLDLVAEGEDAAEQEAFTVNTGHVPMNRAQRRAQVKFYAAMLAETERQTPVVNPTIVPKSARRLRKNSRHAH